MQPSSLVSAPPPAVTAPNKALDGANPLAVSLSTFPSVTRSRDWVTEPNSAAWQVVKSFQNEKKMAAAEQAVAVIRKEAQAQQRVVEWTYALIQQTQLQVGLYNYGTAMRFLTDQPWPQDRLAQVMLQLYYASTLREYLEK